MKKVILFVITLALAVVTAVGCQINNRRLYSIPAVIVAAHRESSVISFVDLRGEEWEFKSDAAWEIGDEVTVVFSTNGTSNIYDDAVVTVDWIGQWED